MLDINLQTINGASTSSATHESLISRTQKNFQQKKKKNLRAQKAIALDAHTSFDIHTRMLIFLFQYHVVGRAHDNYSACEYWHLLWFEFVVLFYLRNNSPHIKKSYKALFHT